MTAPPKIGTKQEVIAVDIHTWDMIVKTERRLMERRLEHRARQGRRTTASRDENLMDVVSEWRINPFSSARVRTREAS